MDRGHWILKAVSRGAMRSSFTRAREGEQGRWITGWAAAILANNEPHLLDQSPVAGVGRGSTGLERNCWTGELGERVVSEWMCLMGQVVEYPAEDVVQITDATTGFSVVRSPGPGIAVSAGRVLRLRDLRLVDSFFGFFCF